MTSSSVIQHFLFISFFLLSFCNAIFAYSSYRPHALFFPIRKDALTNQYITQLHLGTPQVPADLVVDLGGELPWVNCQQGFASSKTYKHVSCDSDQCARVKISSCTKSTHNGGLSCGEDNICYTLPGALGIAAGAEVASDAVSVHSTDGYTNVVSNVSSHRFIFACGPSSLLKGLAKGANGMAGLGRASAALPAQFAVGFRVPRKFSLCLSSDKGVLFFGDGPYKMEPGIDITTSLDHTPLFVNPVDKAGISTTPRPSGEYFIAVKSINIGGKGVRFNKKLLSINKVSGHGGTKISTMNPYTALEPSIYKAFTSAFAKKAKAMNMSRVASVAPFGACYDSTNILKTRAGPLVPTINLVLPEKVIWRIHGANSMVQISDSVICLGFVDGSEFARASVVIGGHQLEENLLQFDIPRSKLGFSSSLLLRETLCETLNSLAK
ncbi:basic 7S globulin 2-like [Papaver somniferum]|uniref:basic 7S globulin 2-like n=1 Tax=Papaver somniferum TaxID=3469 RepID=UPI000E6F8124|nr:basic 7S globulin 2-like [Papaver somniferum]XP_026453729.1 basic 7S globulin 2-like [Papaver somniferum]XP_026453730.1 basic 7S globulin 2-like [Papaver somniferum]XP_026453731.1 basic 7S globulin 2-like [Papaver somniferum]XP_026453732.1 basic 7S globulin 2-like [Papaver somniferum]XP_026453733.1 basic 7S globulin 2-like [Papaver somniferum]XP_026453734.1 basic 7S globulin 2-like [Papaver somniferum]XP_026453735.1 basic 7S globulin 2-like [Papaver somniferum]XP_026453736.1 basic 7S glo